MAFASDTQDQEVRVQGLFWGQVVNNADSGRQGRVLATIPGLVERTGPLRPVGWPGAGSAEEGVYWVPRIGATILVGFIQGDVDEGVYWCGPPGAPRGVPDVSQAAQTAAATDPEGPTVLPDVRALATPSFSVTIHDTPGRHRLRIHSKRDDSTIEINADDHSIFLFGTHLTIHMLGQVDIRGGVVSINGRQVVKASSAPI